MLDAVPDVIPKDFLLHASQRGTHRGNLRHDIDAVAVFFDHSGKPRTCPSIRVRLFLDAFLIVVTHERYITPTGTGRNPLREG